MWQKWQRFLPKGRANILHLAILLVVLLFVMPNVIGWSAVELETSTKLWIFLWLVVLQIGWALIWYIAYWHLRDYIINVVLVRNVMIGLDFIAGLFVVLAVVNNGTIFTVVMTTLGYISMIIWFGYVFSNQKDSDRTSQKLHHFWQQHRHLNQDDVKKMIKQNNAELLAMLDKHEAQSKANHEDDKSADEKR